MIRLLRINKMLLLFLLITKTASAQTFHFSQFHSVPLALNPAMTGNFDENLRVAANYRSQWVNGGTPYLTGSMGLEFRLMSNELAASNKLGIGLHFLTDKSNGGGLQYNAVSASLGYCQTLDDDGDQTIGVGFQGTYHQRLINLSKLSFEEQFTNNGFINALPTGEAFTTLNKKYLDVNIGLLYKYSSLETRATYFIGASAYNILQPNVALTDKIIYQLPFRFTGHFGGNAPIGEQSSLKFSGTYMQMAKASDLTLGMAFDYEFVRETGTGITLGTYYRLGDAAIPYVGLRKNGLQLGFTYDVTASSVKTLSKTRNAYELSILFSPFNSTYKNDGNYY